MISLPSQNDVPASATGVLIVDLDALVRNYQKLKAMVSPAECGAVVKADGYGLSAVKVGQALRGADCKTFFVATLDEAIRLRGALSDEIIYVLDGLFPGSAPDFAANRIRPVLGDLAEIEEWSACCALTGDKLPAALHIDTGMNRLGLKADAQSTLLAEPQRLGGFDMKLIMSHLACADSPDDPKSEVQREDFAAMLAKLPDCPASLANSAAIFHGTSFHYDLVRPGIALYGGNPFSVRSNPMEPVAHLYGRVVQTGKAGPEETIGYGAALTVKRQTRYAAVAVGYADGFFRALGSTDDHAGAIAHIEGHAAPILGRVSMDLTVFDITDLPEGSVKRGDFLELLGKRFTVDDAARLTGTIGYEILTSLGKRFHRIYRGEAKGGGNAADAEKGAQDG